MRKRNRKSLVYVSYGIRDSGCRRDVALLRLSHSAWLTYAAQYQGRVLRSKGNAVAHRVLYLCGPANFGNVIKVAVGIRFFQVDGGRNLVVLHGDECSGDTRGATGALRVSNLGFECRHRDFISM